VKTEIYKGRKIKTAKGKEYGYVQHSVNGVSQGRYAGDEDGAMAWLKRTIDSADEYGISSGRMGNEWYAPGTYVLCEYGHAMEIGGECGHHYCVDRRPAPVAAETTEVATVNAAETAVKIKRGDLVLVELRTSYLTTSYERVENTEYRLMVVTNLTREGKIKMVRGATWGEDAAPAKLEGMLHATGRRWILPKTDWDVELATRIANGHVYPNSDTPRDFPSLEAAREALAPARAGYVAPATVNAAETAEDATVNAAETASVELLLREAPRETSMRIDPNERYDTRPVVRALASMNTEDVVSRARFILDGGCPDADGRLTQYALLLSRELTRRGVKLEVATVNAAETTEVATVNAAETTGRITRVEDLPAKGARDLVTVVIANGWEWAAARDVDSGGNPFVEVLLGRADTGEQYKVTWHTRGTGTYRLFSKIWVKEKGRPWADAPSLRAISARVEQASLAPRCDRPGCGKVAPTGELYCSEACFDRDNDPIPVQPLARNKVGGFGAGLSRMEPEPVQPLARNKVPFMESITAEDLAAIPRARATGVSYDWMGLRYSVWIAEVAHFGWSIVTDYGRPGEESVVTCPRTRDNCIAAMADYVHDYGFGYGHLVDSWEVVSVLLDTWITQTQEQGSKWRPLPPLTESP